MPGIADPTSLMLLLAGAIVAFAGLIHGTLGLGFPMIATPLLALLTDVRSAILVTLVPTVAVNVLSILRGGRWRQSVGRFWPLVLFVALGAVLGTQLLVTVDPAPFKLLLAAIILLYLSLDRLKSVDQSWIRRRTLLAFGAFGVVSGFLAGTVNVMVPVLIIFVLEMDLDRTATVQVLNLCFLTGKLSQVAVLSSIGLFSLSNLGESVPLAIAASIALLAGMAIQDRISADTYRVWLRKALLFVSILLIAQFFATYTGLMAA